MEITVTSNESKNEMSVMVLTDLAATCQKLAENSAVPEELRVQARRFARSSTTVEPDRVFAGRNADQAVDCRLQSTRGQRSFDALAISNSTISGNEASDGAGGSSGGGMFGTRSFKTASSQTIPGETAQVA
jgi:hypothetical protein